MKKFQSDWAECRSFRDLINLNIQVKRECEKQKVEYWKYIIGTGYYLRYREFRYASNIHQRINMNSKHGFPKLKEDPNNCNNIWWNDYLFNSENTIDCFGI
jgi:hypothetical protein